MKRPIQLSDHFTYRKLLQFVFPSIVMMIFTSIYGVVDGLFVSNYAGKTAFAAINLVMPFIMVLGGIGFTMSIFIASLAFADSGAMLDLAKISILSASILSGILGALVFKLQSLRASS